MPISWGDRKHAVAELGKALQRIGWKLFGWKADGSDLMTDYFDPEYWAGIATKDGAVAVVDATAHDSGRIPGRQVAKDEGACPTCNGTGDDPSGWTLTEARKDPERYHSETNPPGTVSLLNVVSPIPFRDYGGVLRCRGKLCHDGRVVSYHTEQVPEERWPTFQGNPKDRVWHVERAGNVLASGTGVFSLLRKAEKAREAVQDEHRGNDNPPLIGEEYEAYRAKARAAFNGPFDALAGQIDRAAALSTSPASPRTVDSAKERPATVSEITVRPGTRAGFVEVVFPAKPEQEVLDELKTAGYRWSRFNSCWYGREGSLPARYREAV
jgi:hypothetical protein